MSDVRLPGVACSARLSVSGDHQRSMQTTPYPSLLVPFAFVLTLHAVTAPVVPAVVPAEVKTSNRNNKITAFS